MTFQDLISKLQEYWVKQECILIQPMDLAVGAATFHPETFLRSLGSKPCSSAYVQACRRPQDGRYGLHPNRMQRYYQFQVVIKPSPENLIQKFLDSLKYININTTKHDIRFVEDNWESPTLGAWGLGWEVWLDGMEITQFTYFQQAGGLRCDPVLGEIAYGLERIAMHLQQVDSVYDIVWSQNNNIQVTYGDLYQSNEEQSSAYNFSYADIDTLTQDFQYYTAKCQELVKNQLPLPAYELSMQASHVFNLLDARGAISTTERQAYILKIRHLTNICAKSYIKLQAN